MVDGYPYLIPLPMQRLDAYTRLTERAAEERARAGEGIFIAESAKVIERRSQPDWSR